MKKDYLREELYLAMMENALDKSDNEYEMYWPEECRKINKADEMYIDSFANVELVIDTVNGLQGYLLSTIESKKPKCNGFNIEVTNQFVDEDGILNLEINKIEQLKNK